MITQHFNHTASKTQKKTAGSSIFESKHSVEFNVLSNQFKKLNRPVNKKSPAARTKNSLWKVEFSLHQCDLFLGVFLQLSRHRLQMILFFYTTSYINWQMHAEVGLNIKFLITGNRVLVPTWFKLTDYMETPQMLSILLNDSFLSRSSRKFSCVT